MPQFAAKLRPPPGRRGFIIPDTSKALPIVYLGWGARRFGESPVAAALNSGYVYAVVTEGAPCMVTARDSFRAPAGSVGIFDANCSMGWKDEPGAHSRILLWIWNQPPTLDALRPAPESYAAWQLNSTLLPNLDRIHRECRHELSTLDGFSAAALEGQHRGLDIAILRSLAENIARPCSVNRYEIGLNWMRQHLRAQQPVAELAVYLGVSESTLQRVFVERCGRRPLEVFQKLKADKARALLADGQSVKAAAFQLGYKHPNDFTRFYSKTFGQPPSDHQK